MMGMDFDFLMLEVCVLSLMNQILQNADRVDVKLLIGVLIAYLVDCFLIWLRGSQGRRNLAKHTLIDE